MSAMGGKRSFRVRQPSTLRNPGYRQEEERGQHDQADPGEPDIQEGQWYGCGIDRHGGPNSSEPPAMEGTVELVAANLRSMPPQQAEGYRARHDHERIRGRGTRRKRMLSKE